MVVGVTRVETLSGLVMLGEIERRMGMTVPV
jgi:hypothetical protein